MRNLPSERTLVAAYWRKLARFVRAGFRTRSCVSAQRVVAVALPSRTRGGYRAAKAARSRIHSGKA
jgi:hypothetical protein